MAKTRIHHKKHEACGAHAFPGFKGCPTRQSRVAYPLRVVHLFPLGTPISRLAVQRSLRAPSRRMAFPGFGPGSRGLGAAEIDLDVEFLFKEVGAALRVAQVFGGIAAGVDLQSDAAALERRANIFHALAMRVVQPFGDAQNGSEAPRDALVVVVERGISGMVAGRLRLAIVIANQSAD